MRGYSDELGGPESLASPSEWGPLGWGDGMTAAGLPAAPSALPSEVWQRDAIRRGWLVPNGGTSPSEDTLRHNHLLRRSLSDPTYGVRDPSEWRRMVARALCVPSVPVAPAPLVSRNVRERGKGRKQPFPLSGPFPPRHLPR